MTTIKKDNDVPCVMGIKAGEPSVLTIDHHTNTSEEHDGVPSGGRNSYDLSVVVAVTDLIPAKRPLTNSTAEIEGLG